MMSSEGAARVIGLPESSGNPVDAMTSRDAATDPHHFAAFLAAIGHRVVRTESAHWYDAGPGFFLSLPSHRLLQPTPETVRSVLRHRPCLGLRFSAPLAGPGKPSYQIVCDDYDYRLEGLSANTRSKVRRGLRRCDVRPVPFWKIREQGRQADGDTISRQGRAARLHGPRWQRYWDAAAATPGMEGWGCYVEDELAAFLVSVRLDDCVEFLLARSRSDRLDAYPNNALIFTVTQEMLRQRGISKVTFGLESLEPVGPLEEFKYSMGFRAEPLKQRVIFHPFLHAVLRRPRVRLWLANRATAVGPGATRWRKAAGLLRFAEVAGEFGGRGSGVDP